MSLLLRVTAFLLVLPFTSYAFECTSSNAFSLGLPSQDTPGSDSSITDICAQFKSDPTAYQACTDNALTGQCNSVGCPDSSSDTTSDLISNPGDDLIGSGSSNDDSGLIKAKRAETLTCNTGDTCWADESGGLYCIDIATGDYRDNQGNSGNIWKDSYNSEDYSTHTSMASSHATASSTRSATGSTSGIIPTMTSTASPASTPSSAANHRVQAYQRLLVVLVMVSVGFAVAAS
ncbi:uncharacterized protein AB675_1106 [Cyphellophora attinorum]|uniref:Uncharacterized protein n=1 Tax=Cyphellophora attinorum TaxID=1664694 RepID=A0A0N0NKN6_9EURO|nr:uncharacterized protein AB675_1106 [Phialophora attinorum]KPI38049.1 hypothetical protein AB675_1106 [Phialophora attinorum]